MSKMTYEHALAIATAAHFGQVDKGGEPYINHCIRVADQMDTEEERAVAVLHDVLEDAPEYSSVLRRHANIHELFNLGKLSRLNYEKYNMYILDVTAAAIARKVKIADLRDNLSPERVQNIPPSLKERYEKALAYLLSFTV